ncbi:MAG: hypothetical protein U5N56_00260 [Candidatus Marinimicrobia bacterium]|nr:hypothetical protein [Candidatus Neomarinimicrobiota bacterium]
MIFLLEVVSNLSNVFLLNKILPFLIKQEKRKWKMIEQDTHDGGKSSHHDVSVAYCSKVAKDRLSILPINGTDKLFSFRLTNKLRLYGLRQNESVPNCFY